VIVEGREIYPSAPIRYVACEVRFPYWPPLTGDPATQQLHSMLGSLFPVVEPGAESTVVLLPQGSLPASDVRTVRFLARSRQRAVYFTPTQLLVETTDYQCFEDFREDVRVAIEALASVGDGVAGVSRIGLRYIDEIRLPSPVEGPSDWRGYIDDRLLAPLDIQAGSVGVGGYQGLLRYDLSKGRGVAMRYGALRGRAVGESPLNLRGPASDGPYFLVDIDSYWVADEGLQSFDTGLIRETCDELHRPIRDLFESSITDRLRDEVFRKGAG
jgi:uncharacterized protein (TIGR04255 family)